MKKSIVWIASAAMTITFLTFNCIPSFADQVILDDLIVDGSTCIGPECVEDEEFAFDTLRLKGDVLRILFMDTSSSASFPSNDWQITINDADDGFLSRFSIDDIDEGTTPFTIEAGAPTNSLYVDQAGRVGIGTSSPDPSAALNVWGNLTVDGTVQATGSIIGLTGVKAGIIPAGSFIRRKATVTFATPYTQNYTVLLTAVSKRKGSVFRPMVLSRNEYGFTIARGGIPASDLVEVHWMTQPVGE